MVGENEAIDALKQKLHQIGNQPQPLADIKPKAWARFDDLMNKMSDDQKVFVANDKDVINKRQTMMSAFTEFMFEKHKDEFSSYPVFEAYTTEYVDAVASTAQKYGQRAAGLQEENEQLRKELEELKAQRGSDLL